MIDERRGCRIKLRKNLSKKCQTLADFFGMTKKDFMSMLCINGLQDYENHSNEMKFIDYSEQIERDYRETYKQILDDHFLENNNKLYEEQTRSKYKAAQREARRQLVTCMICLKNKENERINILKKEKKICKSDICASLMEYEIKHRWGYIDNVSIWGKDLIHEDKIDVSLKMPLTLYEYISACAEQNSIKPKDYLLLLAEREMAIQKQKELSGSFSITPDG